MIKSRKSVLLLLLVLIGLSGCFEFRIPEIGPIVPPKVEIGPYEFFVTSMTVNFDTLMTFLGDQLPLDDYRETYPGDISGNSDWFVMRDTFSTDFDLDMGLEVDPVSSSITQSMEFVEFETRVFSLSDPIELQDIFDLSAIPDDVDVPVDSMGFPTDTSYVSFPMDRQRFASGEIYVTIQNDMVCTLGEPIAIAFFDSTTGLAIEDPLGDPIILEWDTPILSEGSATESLSLAGVEFPMYVMIEVSGAICGDGKDTLITSPAMRSSSFSVNGEIRNMVGEFVEGNLDPQVLSDSSTMDFGADLDDPKLSVDKVYLDTSHISIEISNTSNITGSILLDLYSLDTSETAGIQYFSTNSMIIPSGSSQIYNFNLYNASFDLTQDFKYKTFINIPGQYSQLDASDEFSVSFDFYGANTGDPIRVESVDATFSDMEYTFDDMTMDLNMGELFPEEFQGIELADMELSVDILTDITIPLFVNMNLIGVKNSGADSILLNIDQQITGPGGDNHLVFDDAVRLINFKPDSLIFNGSISLDGTGNMPLNQSLSIEGMFAVPFQFEINTPLSFGMPYMNLQLDTLPAFLDDFTGSVEAQINNSFQFGVDFLILAAHDTNYFDNVAYTDRVRTIADITVPALDTTTQQLVLTKEDYDFVANGADSTWLSMSVALTGRTDGNPTTFLTTDSVSLSLFIQAEGTLDFNELGLDSLGSDTSGGGQ